MPGPTSLRSVTMAAMVAMPEGVVCDQYQTRQVLPEGAAVLNYVEKDGPLILTRTVFRTHKTIIDNDLVLKDLAQQNLSVAGNIRAGRAALGGLMTD